MNWTCNQLCLKYVYRFDEEWFLIAIGPLYIPTSTNQLAWKYQKTMGSIS